MPWAVETHNKPCKHCGLVHRSWSERNKCYYHRNKQQEQRRVRQYRRANKEKIAVGHRRRQLTTLYGLSIEDYDALYRKQRGKCAVCEIKFVELPRAPQVDHDHKTKRVRGLLCSSCNPAIGLLGDTPRLLQRAVAYLNGGENE